MNSFGNNPSKGEKVSLTFDKTIKMKSLISGESVIFSFKITGEKIRAVNFSGDLCNCYQIEEKLENSSWKEGLARIPPLSPLFPNHHQAAFAQIFEKLVKDPIPVPKRAKYLRTAILEIERIQSHLFTIGTIAEGCSYPILSRRIMTLRERVLTLQKRIADNRLVNSYFVFGGVVRDLDAKLALAVNSLMEEIEKSTNKLIGMLKTNILLKRLLKDVGFISRDIAKQLSLVGPMARSTGITTDVRKTDPYAAYGEISFSIPVYDSCDLFGEVLVRYDEIIESSKIIRQLLNNLPQGAIKAAIEDIEMKASSTVMRLESPAGELFNFVLSNRGSIVGSSPRRYKITHPMKINSQGLLARLSGEVVDNIPIIILSSGEGVLSLSENRFPQE